MPDVHTLEQRHKNMAAIRAKDTKPEIIVRKYLWSHGFRYRLNHPRLPGKPDVVLRKYRTCVFVNGCFWHGHGIAPLDLKSKEQELKNEENELKNEEQSEEHEVSSNGILDEIKNSECCKIPHTNRMFWVKKIMRNQERDIKVQKRLATMGWHSITIWECELKPAVREQTLASLAFTLNHIFLGHHKIKRFEIPEESDYSMAAEPPAEYNK